MNTSPPPALPSRNQLIGNILYSMLPLLVFWLVEKYWGLLAGVIAAIVFSVAEVLWIYFRERRWDTFSIGIAFLIIIMGVLSWEEGDTTILRLQPAILEGIFTLLFFGSSIIGKPFMVTMAKKQFGETFLNELQIYYCIS